LDGGLTARQLEVNRKVEQRKCVKTEGLHSAERKC